MPQHDGNAAIIGVVAAYLLGVPIASVLYAAIFQKFIGPMVGKVQPSFRSSLTAFAWITGVSGLFWLVPNLYSLMSDIPTNQSPPSGAALGCLPFLPFLVYLLGCSMVLGSRFDLSGPRAAWMGFLVWAVVALPLMLVGLVVFLIMNFAGAGMK
jgi:hypothetical protein